MNHYAFCLLAANCIYFTLHAQVQVSEEPRHTKVFQNNYIRILDVWIQPGDTTMFHIHSTPSLFTHFTTTKIKTQLEGQDWKSESNTAGTSSYNSFFPESRIHRVLNADSTVFHVMDIEILKPFDTNYRHMPLPYPVVFENEKAVSYRVNSRNLGEEINRSLRPLVAQLVNGEMVLYHDQVSINSKELKKGDFLYIEQGSSFYFSTSSRMPVNMIIYEIK